MNPYPASAPSAPSVRNRLGALALALLAPAAAAEGTPPPGAQADPPALEVTSSGPTEGHVTLVWTPVPGAPEELVYELQVDTDPGFATPETSYRGPDRASFRSGLEAGTHHFRVRQRPASEEGAWGTWSAPVSVEVAPYDLVVAGFAFGIGAVLVLSIVGFLVGANRRVRRTEGAA